jgi:hypothetical protein
VRDCVEQLECMIMMEQGKGRRTNAYIRPHPLFLGGCCIRGSCVGQLKVYNGVLNRDFKEGSYHVRAILLTFQQYSSGARIPLERSRLQKGFCHAIIS